MIAGFLTAVIWVVAFKARALDLYEMIPGFMAAFIATIGVSLATEADPEVMREYDEIARDKGG
jgi:Na+/proline symporter